MTPSVPIGDRIRDARESLGLSQEQLAKALGKTQTAVSYWESGRRQPSVDDLMSISDALHREVHYFLPARPKRGSVKAQFRAMTGRIELHTLKFDVDDFLSRAENMVVPKNQLLIRERDPIFAAEELLAESKVERPPVNIKALAELCGTRVILWSFEDALSGLLLDLEDGPVIGVNKSHPPERRRFSVAHELAHLLLSHHDYVHIDLGPAAEFGTPPGHDWRNEREANDFAANVLMPAEWVRRAVRKNRDVSNLAKTFGVSRIAMSFRLMELGLR